MYRRTMTCWACALKFVKTHMGKGANPTPDRGELKGFKTLTSPSKAGGKGAGNLRAMNEVKPEAGVPPLFYFKPVNDRGGADCYHRSGCMLQVKRQQQTKDGKTVNHQDHFRCPITCGFCRKRCHYEAECQLKKRDSDKRKRQGLNARNFKHPAKTPRMVTRVVKGGKRG